MIIQNLENKDINELYIFLLKNKNIYFTPHIIDKDIIIENINSDDKYYILKIAEIIVGYGMLRGYDEGYIIPSLGIMIDKDYRGLGYSKLLMLLLENEASKTSDKIRLTVFKENKKAISLYKKLDYIFEDYNEKSLIGLKKIK